MSEIEMMKKADYIFPPQYRFLDSHKCMLEQLERARTTNILVVSEMIYQLN